MLERASDITFGLTNTPRPTNHVCPRNDHINYSAFAFILHGRATPSRTTGNLSASRLFDWVLRGQVRALSSRSFAAYKLRCWSIAFGVSTSGHWYLVLTCDLESSQRWHCRPSERFLSKAHSDRTSSSRVRTCTVFFSSSQSYSCRLRERCSPRH